MKHSSNNHLILHLKSYTYNRGPRTYLLRISSNHLSHNCEIQSQFIHAHEYVYRLWEQPSQQDQILQIQLFDAMPSQEGVIYKLRSQKQMVLKYPYEQTTRLEGGKSETKFLVLLNFKVQSQNEIQQKISHQKVRQMNHEMAQHLDKCKQQLKGYHYFLKYTNKIIKSLTDSPQMNEQNSLISQNKQLSMEDKRNRKLVLNNSKYLKDSSKQGQNQFSQIGKISKNNQKPKIPNDQISISTIYPILDALDENQNQKENQMISSKNSIQHKHNSIHTFNQQNQRGNIKGEELAKLIKKRRESYLKDNSIHDKINIRQEVYPQKSIAQKSQSSKKIEPESVSLYKTQRKKRKQCNQKEQVKINTNEQTKNISNHQRSVIKDKYKGKFNIKLSKIRAMIYTTLPKKAKTLIINLGNQEKTSSQVTGSRDNNWDQEFIFQSVLKTDTLSFHILSSQSQNYQCNSQAATINDIENSSEKTTKFYLYKDNLAIGYLQFQFQIYKKSLKQSPSIKSLKKFKNSSRERFSKKERETTSLPQIVDSKKRVESTSSNLKKAIKLDQTPNRQSIRVKSESINQVNILPMRKIRRKKDLYSKIKKKRTTGIDLNDFS